MTRRVHRSKMWVLRYIIPFVASVALVLSAYYLLLPLERKLELLCVLDDAHLAEEEPAWHPGYWRVQYTEWVDGYWTCPRCDANLTVTVIWSTIDAGMWVFYCDTESVFWIGQAIGPLKGSVFHGPYQGYLWKLANAVNPIALVTIILSAIALLYTLGYSTKTRTRSHTEREAPLPTFQGFKDQLQSPTAQSTEYRECTSLAR